MMERVLTKICQLGIYKLLFSAKVAFCFVLLFISTAIVIFSGWAVCKHIIDSATFGTVVVTFGGIAATLATIYNVIHGMSDRVAMQIAANTATASALADTNTATATASTLAATNTANALNDNPAVVSPPPDDPDLPAKGTL
jgi:hypothetical protein